MTSGGERVVSEKSAPQKTETRPHSHSHTGRRKLDVAASQSARTRSRSLDAHARSRHHRVGGDSRAKGTDYWQTLRAGERGKEKVLFLNNNPRPSCLFIIKRPRGMEVVVPMVRLLLRHAPCAYPNQTHGPRVSSNLCAFLWVSPSPAPPAVPPPSRLRRGCDTRSVLPSARRA